WDGRKIERRFPLLRGNILSIKTSKWGGENKQVWLGHKCMTSRHTRKNTQGELVTFTNQELARLERTNRQQPRQTDTTMGDHANQDDLAAAMTLMQQQMQQMQQTIQAQQDAAEHAALAQQEQQAQTKIDELTAKVDQLLKNNHGYVFNMEQATSGQIQNQNQRQPQSNQQAVPASGNSQPDELNSLGMMMQQLLQGQQVQAKVLNQVTTEIDTRMGYMFTELNNKYDNLAIHIRKIDVQLAQTAESVKRQQETLPRKTDKNPRTEHCNAIEQPFAETVLGSEENIEQSASSGVTGPSVPSETSLVRVYVPKVPYPIPPRHLMDPISEEQLIGFNKMVRRLPKELAFEDALQIRPLLQFVKNCRETQEEIKVLYTKALSTPALKVLPKVDDPGKFIFPCSIAGTTFKDALCYSEKLKVVPEKEHGDKDGSAGTKEAENNAIWWFSRRTVLMTVPDSGATRVTVPSECSSGRDFLGNYNHYGICPNYPYFLSQPPVALIYHILLVLPPIGPGNCPLAPWILWAIWTARNQKLAIRDAKEWAAAQLPISQGAKRFNPQQNRRSSDVICKSDAAWKKEVQAAGLAWSLYSNQLERISSHNQPVAFVISSLLAEGLAIRSAMKHAIDLRMRHMVFETDSLQLVAAIADKTNFSDLHGVLSDIYLLSIFFDPVSFRFCRRESLCFEDFTTKKTLSDFVVTQTA
ncbi:hypothetical protein IGI04_019707, partial [Brassica rapa subsp. trilocularis]